MNSFGTKPILTAKPKLNSKVNHSFQEDFTHFQALGTVKASFDRDAELGTCLVIKEKKYRAYFTPYLYAVLNLQLKNEPNTVKETYIWNVYPKVVFIPKQEPQLIFQVISWGETTALCDPGIFVFRGVWQFIPQSRPPVLSIYRNKRAVDLTKKYRVNHLPIIMRREDANPYKFIPKQEKTEVTKYFIQALFRFLPDRNAWGYLYDLTPPTTEIPSYIKLKPTDKKKKNDTKRQADPIISKQRNDSSVSTNIEAEK